MSDKTDLERFVKAQESSYETALAEIKRGRKLSHWMWYIFPQIQGLGFSATSKLYAIKDRNEAEAFLTNPLLGSRLVDICNELLQLESNDAHRIFGSPDDMKLKSSMTLFAALNVNPVFQLVLDKFFGGAKDDRTLLMIERQR